MSASKTVQLWVTLGKNGKNEKGKGRREREEGKGKRGKGQEKREKEKRKLQGGAASPELGNFWLPVLPVRVGKGGDESGMSGYRLRSQGLSGLRSGMN